MMAFIPTSRSSRRCVMRKASLTPSVASLPISPSASGRKKRSDKANGATARSLTSRPNTSPNLGRIAVAFMSTRPRSIITALLLRSGRALMGDPAIRRNALRQLSHAFRLKPRSPISALPLLKSKAVIIERGLVDIKATAIRPKFGDVLGRESRTCRSSRSLCRNLFFRPLALGDIGSDATDGVRLAFRITPAAT